MGALLGWVIIVCVTHIARLGAGKAVKKAVGSGSYSGSTRDTSHGGGYGGHNSGGGGSCCK